MSAVGASEEGRSYDFQHLEKRQIFLARAYGAREGLFTYLEKGAAKKKALVSPCV